LLGYIFAIEKGEQGKRIILSIAFDGFELLK
jgi:hypothetical protein